MTLNAPLKVSLRNSFTKWYGDKVSTPINANGNNIDVAVKAVHPDFRLSIMKPVHGRWIIDAISALQEILSGSAVRASPLLWLK